MAKVYPTEENKISVIEEDIKSIRTHLKNIKERQDQDDLNRTDQNKKIDMIYNSLTDNSFNSNQGYITILRKVETIVILHDLYWKIFFAIIALSGFSAILLKLFLPK
jgi:hypothetical protein